MPKPIIPHDAYVFIGDGQKALFLRNQGDEKFPNLVTEQVFAQKDPPTHVQGSDRPGREFAAAHSTIRSAIEPTDWHRIEEDRFVRSVCEALERLVRERAAPALIVVAPPRALADLRKSLHPDVKAKVIAEINKDLTKHPVPDIERHVLRALTNS